MKFLILLFLVGCAHKPKYSAGDCVAMDAMTITFDGGWDSSGYRLSDFKILEIIKTEKMNKYMAKHIHAKMYYKIKVLEDPRPEGDYVIPVEDLDNFRYAHRYWRPEGYNHDKCNSYEN